MRDFELSVNGNKILFRKERSAGISWGRDGSKAARQISWKCCEMVEKKADSGFMDRRYLKLRMVNVEICMEQMIYQKGYYYSIIGCSKVLCVVLFKLAGMKSCDFIAVLNY